MTRCLRPSLDPTQLYRARIRENYNSQSSSHRTLSSINQVVRVSSEKSENMMRNCLLILILFLLNIIEKCGKFKSDFSAL
ncbi:hypothetical protein U0070_001673 [Myodes glareolus]|uniref:Uncharacterized protein n=1 Tax=Myodes glareolus TaxID=447135 RepID=A0AAW0H770_MYOGA